MCGGDMEISADKTFGTCDFCGSTMTLPKLDDEQRASAFNRGNHFRRIGEFDKALAVYERIVSEDDTDAEAHWCCALCRFGIEYVEDPTTYEWVPTCHRASFDSILEDVDYLAAVEHSDGLTKRQYQKDAAKIAEVQRGILATSQNEEPFDVFICYKESDANGDRTRDSQLAQDIYYQLNDKGYRTFFARITLEDKVGSQYEPYIFAALNSAKVMVVVGTSAEHLNAVWVKNEWSRYLAIMKKDRSKLLLPCYRDMDPYDLPEQLSVLQSYDMSKIGFIQDLIRGISKVLDAEKKPEPVQVFHETVVQQASGGGNVTALLERGNMALEDGEWQKADSFFEEVLNQNAKCAEAYFGKFLAQQRRVNMNAWGLCAVDEFKETIFKVVRKTACEEETARIEQAKKLAVEGYLTEKELTVLYHYDRTYPTTSDGARTCADCFFTDLESNKLLVRSRDFAADVFAAELAQIFTQIRQSMDAYAEELRQTEENAREQLCADYAVHVDAADEQAKALHARALEKKASYEKKVEMAYQEACELLVNAKDDYQRQQAVRELHKLKGYKDADAFLAAEEARQEELRDTQRRAYAWRSAGKCQHCGGNFMLLGMGKCSKCGKKKDY